MRIIRIRAAKWAGFQPDDLIQAHIIKYETGAPIGWHRDAPPYNAVIGISLNTPCRFQMRHRKADGSFDRFETIAEPRSIYLLSGPARSNWQHGIPPVSDLRYSITFRTK
jgi:alkylated DNA repair dioxygenase AlkB